MNLEQKIQALKQLGLGYCPDDSYQLKDICVPVADIKSMDDEGFDHMLQEMKAFIAENPDYQAAAIPAQSKELTIIDKALVTLKSGSEILQGNQVSAASAKQAARALLDRIKAGGKMTPELHTETIGLLKKIGATVKKLNENRKPYTQAMDLIKGEFTTCENDLQESRQGTEAYELKLHADDYVKKCALEKQAEEARIEQQRLKNQATIDYKASVEKWLIEYFNQYLAGKKTTFNNRFNAITLDNYQAECEFFTTVNFQYSKEHYSLFAVPKVATPLNDVERSAIYFSVVTEEKYNELCTLYFDAMIGLRVEKVELLASKKNELDRIREFELEQEKERLENERIANERKSADAARRIELDKQQAILDQQENERKEQQRIIEEQQAIRLREEQEAIAEQQRIDNEREQAKVAVTASQATTTNMFAAQAESSNIGVAAPKTKTGYDVEVLNPIAWLEVFNFWFQNEGAGWNDEKMRKKFGFMLNIMEKLALKNGTMLESANIKYHPTYESVKEITRKNKLQEVEDEQ